MPRSKSKPKKVVQSKLWLYCEGTKTEVNYLNKYKTDKHCNNRLVSLIRVPQISQNTPKSIVDRVVEEKRKSSSHKGDIHWVIYDRESITKYSEKLHSQAIKKATDNNIKVALSNVCFELWILLHFGFSEAAYSDCKALTSSKAFKENIKKVGIENYEKGQADIYTRLKPYLNDARKNAEKLVIQNKGSYPAGTPTFKMNPSTDFHLVLDAIDNFVK
ncbi:RloB family protein [Neptunicella marina]|uniref:RloB domain-containing protein n=1 Tax=Neptunicella marina TaxID=2125989 RepID=A0A8J6IWZ7_9ALTE|nr:RloB family protein [Neptunicella marina]MBC3767207.1 RloB domain-containing protein [Neptunicella marina]